MAELTKQEKTVVDSFMNLQRSLFSDGEIPSLEEVRARIDSGNHTVADSFIAKMYNDGVPDEPILAELDETKDFYSKFEKSFSREVVGPARNTTGISNNITKLEKGGIDLGLSFSDFEEQSKTPGSGISEDVRKNIVRPFKAASNNVLELKLSRTGAAKGTRKLAKGAIPAEVLQSVLQGIGDIPDAVTRDAVMASLLGYRGEDLSGMRTSRALAIRSKPVRPFYDREAGVARDPEVATGGGRKAKGPDKPPGPVLREILNRRFDAAGATGELFPGMTTAKISAALKKHVFTKIPQDVLDKLLTKPSGYTDLRRITASAIANQLGRPDLASEIISHKGSGESLLDKVMTGYYTDVEDISGLQQRGEILVAYEKMMADAVGATDAKGLGEALRLDFTPEFNAQYPEIDAMATPSQAPVQPTQATPEQIAQGEEFRAAKTAEATEQARLAAQETGDRADDVVIRRGARATEVAEANLKIQEAKAEVKAGKAAEQDANRVKNHQSTLDFIKNTYKKIPGPVKKAVPFVGAIPAFYGMAGVKESLAGQMEDMGISRSIADPVASVGAGADFLIGAVAPAAPSDVVSIAQSIPERPSMMQAADTRQAQVQDTGDEFGNLDQQGQPVPSAPINIPDPVPSRQGMLSAGGAKERVNQARSAALAGQETSMSGSFLN
jgi:hypothetical protein